MSPNHILVQVRLAGERSRQDNLGGPSSFTDQGHTRSSCSLISCRTYNQVVVSDSGRSHGTRIVGDDGCGDCEPDITGEFGHSDQDDIFGSCNRSLIQVLTNGILETHDQARLIVCI